MKTTYTIFLCLISILSNSQLKIDSSYSLHWFLQIETSPFSIYTCSQGNGGYGLPFILRYDANLTILDTLKGSDIGRNNDRFVYPFHFNNNLFVFCLDNDTPSNRNFSIHKIEHGQFTDSIGLNLDTIIDGYPALASQVDPNTLRIIVQQYGTSGLDSRIVDLDSNFNLKAYHRIDFTITSISTFINSVYEVSDSLWHVYTHDGLSIYNPKTKQTLAAKPITGNIYSFQKLSNTEYLAFGISSVLAKPPSRSTAYSSLGFYKVNSSADFIDTVSFNAFSHPLGPNYIEYSYESLHYDRNALIYDSSNVYLASQGQYSKPNSSDTYRYFHVVKTDFDGNLKWRWIWGSTSNTNFVNFMTIAPTPDKGCLIIGQIRQQGVVIKLGPDGNISNVELDAPETVVSFYPNPVKDQLHYSFLPEAKGPYTLEIIDMQGKPVLEKTLDSEKGFVPVNLHSGFYLYHLKNKEGKVQQVGKILVE